MVTHQFNNLKLIGLIPISGNMKIKLIKEQKKIIGCLANISKQQVA